MTGPAPAAAVAAHADGDDVATGDTIVIDAIESSSADARVAAAPGALAVCLIKGESSQQKNGSSIQAESSRAKLSNILKRPRSRSVGGDAAATSTGSGADESARRTKGSKRFEARWGRPQQQTSSPSPLSPPSPSLSQSQNPALFQPISLSRSTSAPSAALISGTASGRGAWFRRGASSVSRAALAASPSWEDTQGGRGGSTQIVAAVVPVVRSRQDYIDDGCSEDFDSSEEDEIEEQFRRDRSHSYPLNRGISDPLHSYQRHQLSSTERSCSNFLSSACSLDDTLIDEEPQTSQSFGIDSPSPDPGDAYSNSISSDDDSSLDSDTLLGFGLDEEEGLRELAQELSTPQRQSRSSSARRKIFRSPRLSSRPQTTSPGYFGAALENVTEDLNEDRSVEDMHELRDADLEAGRNNLARRVASRRLGETVGAAAAFASGDADEEITTESNYVTEDSGPKSVSYEDGGVDELQDGRDNDNEISAPFDEAMRVRYTGNEYYRYDPEAPLSPPPEAAAGCPTPLASNLGRKKWPEPSFLQLPGTAENPNNSDQYDLPPIMPSITGAQAIPLAATVAPRNRWKRRPFSTSSTISAADTKSTSTFMSTILIAREYMDPKTLFYLSIFSILGSTLRVYISRLFGFDCAFPNTFNDAFTVAFKNICVTNTGSTLQSGGALFIDLPANMIGSTIMGIMSSSVTTWPSIPWLKADHPIQQHNALKTAICTGLCGSLTTFASWNAQMVRMIDGTDLPLGRQVIAALFGYILGLQASIASFLFGRKLNVWLNRWRNPEVCQELDDLGVSNPRVSGMFGSRSRILRRRERKRRRRSRNLRYRVPEDLVITESGSGVSLFTEAEGRNIKRMKNAKNIDNASLPNLEGEHGDFVPTRIIVFPSIGDIDSEVWCRRVLGFFLRWRTVPVLLVVVLFSLYLISDLLWDIDFYRSMWISVLLTPPGAILRWKLQLLNNGGCSCCKDRTDLGWLPLGTVVANVIGSIVAIAAVAFEARYGASTGILAGLKIGFAGSLSTVSSFVKEVVDITERYPIHGRGYIYAFGTMALCCFLSLAIYSPIVRS